MNQVAKKKSDVALNTMFELTKLVAWMEWGKTILLCRSYVY